MERPDIHRLIDLQKLLLQFHSITRAIRHPADFDRHETDTEHSYSLALAGWFLAHYFPELDKNAVIQLALVHDLLEVYAGDTQVFGTDEALKSKADREAAAIASLHNEWADFPDMLASIRAYEAGETNESKFVYALDKLMPIIMNYLNRGLTWRYEGITLQRLEAEKQHKIKKSPEIYSYYEALHQLLVNEPGFFATAERTAES